MQELGTEELEHPEELRRSGIQSGIQRNSLINRISMRLHDKVAVPGYTPQQATSFEYIEVFYNRKRQHSTLGYKSPIRFLENWLSEQQQEKLVA